MYFYTGLIKYLEAESAFAGVVAHEIAHADKRHTTERLTKIMGVQTVLNILLGKGTISDVLTTLMALKYSRNDEYEADEWSVRYLCPTGYIGDGAAQFFEQLEEDGHTGSTFQWLSTHPSPDNRIEELHKHGVNYGCNDTEAIDQWQDFQNSLP
jgi:predicted Zn-dependent protease